jgi:excisionase family DNA binding protein
MSRLGRSLLLGAASVGSLVAGVVLITLGRITRQEQAVAAGKRRFHGFAFERRWISDPDERTRHAEIVAERLDEEAKQAGEVTVAQAAERLGVSVSTVRRRARSGQLKGAYRGERLTGVILEGD